MSEKKEGVFKRLKNKYRLIIYNDDTFEEVWSYKLNRINLVTLSGITIFVLIGIVYILIAYTPLKVYVIPDFPKTEERKGIIENALRTDSLENQLRMHKQYIENVRQILAGKEPSFYLLDSDSARRYENLTFTPSREDSLLRKEIEEEEFYNLSLFQENYTSNILTDIHFCAPVKGYITSSFEINKQHFGVDVVTVKDETVKAIHDGVVVSANWTIETGFTIMIQHENNLLSVYKHCASLFRKVGDKVEIGEAIAIVGNTGETSTGPHLHFEIWHLGIPVNPEEYIVF
jgi:murein DD-endopeptidase MepM/ murein hydrolase activator NlpD